MRQGKRYSEWPAHSEAMPKTTKEPQDGDE